MKTNYVLIDYENVQVKSLALLSGEHYRVRIFLGPKNTKLPTELVVAIQALGDRADYVVLETPGSNALDFHIAYYLGRLAVAEPAGFFHIISKDTGFDPLIQHLRAQKVLAARSASIEEMPCFNQPPVSVVNTSDASVPNPLVSPPARRPIDDLVKLAVDDLIRRNGSKPRTPKTLRSTVHAKCGKHLPAADIDAIYAALVKRGYVKLNGTKLSYALPSLPETV